MNLRELRIRETLRVEAAGVGEMRPLPGWVVIMLRLLVSLGSACASTLLVAPAAIACGCGGAPYSAAAQPSP